MPQYPVPNTKYKIDAYLPDHKLAIEIHEKKHMDRPIAEEKKTKRNRRRGGL